LPFDKKVRDEINAYVTRDIADEAWHNDFFRFISDPKLAARLAEEFISARWLYKILEGLSVTKWMLRTQVRAQIFSYASIYEAAIHHLLFVDFASDDRVIALQQQLGRTDISIPATKMELLKKHLNHGGSPIIVTKETSKKIKTSKIRFDKKAECARDIGLIDNALCLELVEFYEARNSIHIHAEIRKSMKYQMDLSWRAYRRMQLFKEQVESALASQRPNLTFPEKSAKSLKPKPSGPKQNLAVP
jgi:hypothetical protein